MYICIMRVFIILLLLAQFSFTKSLEKVVLEEYITVGVKYDYKPFSFINNEGRLEGFDIDLIKSMMDILNIRVKFVEVSSNNKEKMLLDGKIDILLTDMIPQENKNNDIIFTKPYFFDDQIILVNSTTKINNFSDLKGKHVGSIKGSIRLENLLKIQPDVISLTFTQYPQLITALSFKNIDAVTADSLWAKEQIQSHYGKFKILNEVICNNKYAIALTSDNIKLKEKINLLFEEISNNNTYENIYKKWFKAK
ncbi:substrate-binding periplasmic protein [Arcobacter sp.]|uniref:substrate-binding periplasmic protein n=1 Tax=Arcobacter sp. TaxID=1872629 RepID=UPI003D0CBCF9